MTKKMNYILSQAFAILNFKDLLADFAAFDEKQRPIFESKFSSFKILFFFLIISLTQLNIFITSIPAEAQDLTDQLTCLKFKTKV